MKLPRGVLALLVVTAAPGVSQTAPVTLMPPASLEKAPDPDGFLERWVLLEPIEANGLTDSAVQAIVKKEYFPNQFTVLPHDGDKVTVGGAELSWHAVDTRLYNVNLYHFAHALGKSTTNVLFWAVTVVNAPREIPGVRLAIGSNAASVWWVNGEEVIGIYGDRQTVIDDGVSKRLTLKRGPNIIRAAVVNGGGATDFCARFLDPDDRPLKSITVRLYGAPAAPSPTGRIQREAGASRSPYPDYDRSPRTCLRSKASGAAAPESIDTQPQRELLWRFSESSAERPMRVESRLTCLDSQVAQQYVVGAIFGRALKRSLELSPVLH